MKRKKINFFKKRTNELADTVEQLKPEIEEQKQIEAAYRKAEQKPNQPISNYFAIEKVFYENQGEYKVKEK